MRVDASSMLGRPRGNFSFSCCGNPVGDRCGDVAGLRSLDTVKNVIVARGVGADASEEEDARANEGGSGCGRGVSRDV